MNSTGPLDLMLSLMQTLSHQVRTPLSVISNDLTFFQSLIDPSECERGISKCRQISDLFKPAQLLVNSSTKPQLFNLLNLLREVFESSFESEMIDLQCQGVQNNLRQAFSWINELLPIESVGFLADKCLLRFKLLSSIDIKDNPREEGPEHLKISCMSEIYAAYAIDASVLPILIDAVLVSFSVECRVISENEFSLMFVGET